MIRHEHSSFASFADLIQRGLADSKRKLSFHRSRAPEETLAQLMPLMRSAGITRIADVTGLDRLGIPVVMVVRPNSRSLAVSQGKGPNLIAAKVSGVMEALEGYHAEQLGLPIRLLRWSDLAGTSHAPELDRFPFCENSLFHAEKRLPWVSAIDLVSGTERLVPLELVHTDFTLPRPPGAGCFPMSSDGLASGNTFTEAIVHGLCELIERDAFATYIDGRQQPRTVSLEAVDDYCLLAMIDGIRKAGGHLLLQEITFHHGPAVFFATIHQGGEASVTAAPAGGIGCHPDRTWACIRAVTEAAQARLTRLSGARDDLTPKWFPSNRMNDAKSLHSAPEEAIPLSSVATFYSDTAEEDLLWIVHKLEERGMTEILVVDLSNDDFNIPVVRMLVPGLRRPPSQHWKR